MSCTRCDDTGKVLWFGPRGCGGRDGPCPKCCTGRAYVEVLNHRDSVWPRSALRFPGEPVRP